MDRSGELGVAEHGGREELVPLPVRQGRGAEMGLERHAIELGRERGKNR
jgi:hypothetical protein